LKKKKKIKIHTDYKGRNYIRKSYFVGGKMKFRKIYVIDGIPEDEFYEKNATDIDHLRNGEYWLINSEKDSDDLCDKSNNNEPDLSDNKFDELPF
jgi:hypothetical protein